MALRSGGVAQRGMIDEGTAPLRKESSSGERSRSRLATCGGGRDTKRMAAAPGPDASDAAFEAWAHGITPAARHFPGHLGASVLDAPGSRDYHILCTFTDRRRMQAWLDSDERQRWQACRCRSERWPSRWWCSR
jgi:hypothetical protein